MFWNVIEIFVIKWNQINYIGMLFEMLAIKLNKKILYWNAMKMSVMKWNQKARCCNAI